MKLIKPKVTFFSQDSPYKGRFEVEPLERGVGTTIGTLLEVHLLNLYPVVKPCAFKFSNHNSDDMFSPVPGIEETTDEIIDNLRQVTCIADDLEGSVTATLSPKSKGVITAKDLSVSGVKIVSTGQKLFTVTGDPKKVKFELLISRNTGYHFAEDFTKEDGFKKDFTYFNVNFSPVSSISYSVGQARVGRSINYDKLILDMTVYEGHAPQSLMQNAVVKLQQFFERISDVIPEEVTEFAMHKVETETVNDNLSISINDLELSIRCRNCLKQIEIKTLADLTERSIDELMEIKNFGKKSLDELREIMTRYNLKFKDEN